MKLITILLSVALSILMFVALGDNPYSYYQFLRVVTLLIGGFIIYLIHPHDQDSRYIWYFVAVVLLFNPLLPIYLDRGIWSVINLSVAVSTPIITTIAFRTKN